MELNKTAKDIIACNSMTPLYLELGKGTRYARGVRRLSKFIGKRPVLRDYLNVWPQRLPSPPGVFAAIYRFGVSELLVFVNITDESQSVKIHLALNKDYAEVLSLHECEYGDGEITLSSYAGIWLQK